MKLNGPVFKSYSVTGSVVSANFLSLNFLISEIGIISPLKGYGKDLIKIKFSIVIFIDAAFPFMGTYLADTLPQLDEEHEFHKELNLASLQSSPP